MRIPRISLVLILCLLSACTTQITDQTNPDQVEQESSVEPTATMIEEVIVEPTETVVVEEITYLPIEDADLEGIWIRVISSLPDPDKSGHFWLKLDPDGTYKATLHKMDFEDDVTHQGPFEFKDNVITLTAVEGSARCVGYSASYEIYKIEDGSLIFVTVEVPCEDWLSMGQGKLGEDTLWMRPNE